MPIRIETDLKEAHGLFVERNRVILEHSNIPPSPEISTSYSCRPLSSESEFPSFFAVIPSDNFFDILIYKCEV